MRDIEGDYRRALLDEYTAYVRAGRDADAGQVAAVLREVHGHEVAPVAPEHTAAERLPETAVPPKPQREAAGEPEPKAVRAWAAENGVDVPARGKLSAEVVEAYKAAQGGE